MSDFQINLSAKVEIVKLGAEQEPLLIVDDLMVDPQALVERAVEGATYGPAGAAYPGLRAALPDGYNQALYGGLKSWFRDVFAIEESRAMELTSSFALITDRADKLKPVQRVPHCDRHGADNLAMVHYLCGPGFGGTSFFRHKSTGFETISDERQAEYNVVLNREMNRQVVPAGFPDDSHPFFERIATVNAQFNRMVFYRSRILHSPAIQRDAHFSADPRQGRLTITAFLNPPHRA